MSDTLNASLTGNFLTAEDALRFGLVNHVVPHEELMPVTMELANAIGSCSLPSLLAAKEMVGRALEGSTSEGIKFERRLFNALFSTHDQDEGMTAFVEKRPPAFKDS